MIRKESFRRTRKTSRNQTQRNNYRAIFLAMYYKPFLKWTRYELRQIHHRMRKFITTQKPYTQEVNSM